MLWRRFKHRSNTGQHRGQKLSNRETFEPLTKEDGGFKDSTVKVVEGLRLPVKEAWRVQESHQGLSRALKSCIDPHN